MSDKASTVNDVRRIGEQGVADFAARSGLIIGAVPGLLFDGKKTGVALPWPMVGMWLTWVSINGRACYRVEGEVKCGYSMCAAADTPEAAFDGAMVNMIHNRSTNPHRAQLIPATAAPAAEGAPLPPILQPSGRPRVYVCHPYSNDPTGNAAKVAAICKSLIGEFLLPIAPQIYLGAFIDDAKDRELAMDVCLDLLAGCDEVRVYGPTLSPGMLDELRFAMAQGMRIVHVSGDDHP